MSTSRLERTASGSAASRRSRWSTQHGKSVGWLVEAWCAGRRRGPDGAPECHLESPVLTTIPIRVSITYDAPARPGPSQVGHGRRRARRPSVAAKATAAGKRDSPAATRRSQPRFDRRRERRVAQQPPTPRATTRSPPVASPAPRVPSATRSTGPSPGKAPPPRAGNVTPSQSGSATAARAGAGRA